MGVFKLQTFLENYCEEACYRVEIENLVIKRRNQLPEEEIVIVVDGQCCIRELYKGLKWIGGGQLKEFSEKARFFVQQFERLGVRLVFYFDGPTVESKRQNWVQRRLSRLESVYRVLKSIEDGKQSNQIDSSRNFLLPPGMGQLARAVFEDICLCKVYQSLSECDEEIADFARNHRAFAILSQDSDFVIHKKGQAMYLSMEKLNLQNMTTLYYDHQQLALCLDLYEKELPLLATLMGNDIIPVDQIKHFHHKQVRNRHIDYGVLVPALANYIRRLRLTRGRTMDDVAEEFSSRLFGGPDKANYVLRSINSYSTVTPRDHHRQDRHYWGHWKRLLDKARDRHTLNEAPGMVYAIMCGLPFESSTSLEDFRKDDLPSFAKATEVIRRRIYGILLHEKPLDQGQACHYVLEWCMAGPDSLDEPKRSPALPAHKCHPGLLALWDKKLRKKNNQINPLRWQLFVKSVSPRLNVEKVKSLPKRLLIPTMVLACLNDQEERQRLRDWEVDAVLATAVCMPQYTTAMLRVLPADPMTTRGIRIANLIMQSTFVFYLLLAACGYPASVKETAPSEFFDGKLFQIKYNQAKDGCAQGDLYNNEDDNRQWFVRAQEVIGRQH